MAITLFIILNLQTRFLSTRRDLIYDNTGSRDMRVHRFSFETIRYVCDSAVERKVLRALESYARLTKKKGRKRVERPRWKLNSFSDRHAGVNDLAAYCTPVERVDSGYANIAHGPTKPFLLRFSLFFWCNAPFSPLQWRNPFLGATVAHN